MKITLEFEKIYSPVEYKLPLDKWILSYIVKMMYERRDLNIVHWHIEYDEENS